jgi:hypothetical protein
MIDAVAEQDSKRVKTKLPVLFSKTKILDTMIGTQVKKDIAGFVPPTIWSSIAQLTTLLHGTNMRIPDILQLSTSIKNELCCEFLPLVEQKPTEEIQNLKRGIQEPKGLLAGSIQQIADCFHQQPINVNDMRARLVEVAPRKNTVMQTSNSGVSSSDVRTYVKGQIEVVKNIMMVMDQKPKNS